MDITFNTATAINYADDYRLNSDRQIQSMILEAAHVFDRRWYHSRLVFKRNQKYTVNLINHLGEVIETSHTYDKDIEMEILCDGDIYRAMSDPSLTMREFFDKIKDNVAAELFDISLTQTICDVSWNINGDRANVVIWFNDSPDGQTNIDAEVIDAILSIIESKYGHWQAVIDNMCSTRELF